jgi:hypothetical protein
LVFFLCLIPVTAASAPSPQAGKGTGEAEVDETISKPAFVYKQTQLGDLIAGVHDH